ncbi:MFS transporter [Marmoricola endophyticus]|uniref:MFS transporter n=1 Tax=Marmoricola endophyticus TaxID=2040280 RepID=A0A917BJA2_9ACTN|nr:MFS transporter [Marmoricola endophyticus]GGF48245.1 MFS transporter [Marmoricola endophyticus]
MSRPSAAAPQGADPRPMTKIAAAGVAASVAEWLDFFIYTTAAALVFGQLFFPEFSSSAGTIASFGTLAVGFVARPIGGIIAGQLGDRYGRRPVLVGAMVLMGLATLLIGFLPTYASIGAWAPTLLIALRCVQGLGVGAQWGGAALLLTEHAPVERRGFFGSMVQVGAVAGSAIATGIFYLLTSLMSDSAFESWGWRLPFFAGVVVVFVGIYIQRQIEDTPVFQEMQAAAADEAAETPAPRKQPVLDVLRHHPVAVLQAAGAFLVVNAAFYVLSTGMVDFGTRIVGLSRGEMLGLVLGAGITQVVTVPLFGRLSDNPRIRRRRLFLLGAVLIAIWVYPMFLLVETGSGPLVFLGLVVAYTVHSMMYGPQAALYAEMFPSEVRFSGASLGYQVASVLAGGLAPIIMTALLAATGASWSVALYLVGMAVLTFIAVYSIKEVFRRSFLATPARTAEVPDPDPVG